MITKFKLFENDNINLSFWAPIYLEILDISKDSQFDINSNDFIGFLNTDPTTHPNNTLTEIYKLHKQKNKFLKYILSTFKLRIDSALYDEVIFDIDFKMKTIKNSKFQNDLNELIENLDKYIKINDFNL